MKIERLRPLQLLRHGVQTAVAAYVLVIVIAGTVGETWAANLHTICPFGGVVNLYTYLGEGDYVAKLHSAVFIMLLALVIGLVLTGKSFCGWICPLGSIQEALGGIGKRLWPRAYNRVPRSAERVLQYLKYVVLIWVLVQTARSAQLIFQDWDPYFSLYHIWTDEVAISGYVVAGLTVVASLFIPRPFSRYACPLGAINGLFNWFSFIGITRDSATCTECGLCTKVCPVNIDLCASTTVRSIECTRCLKCVDACPQNPRAGDTLRLRTWFGRLSRARTTVAAHPAGPATAGRRAVPRGVFVVVAIAAFAVPILVTNLTGDFEITRGGGGGGGGGEGHSGIEDAAGDGNLDGGETEGSGQIIRGSTALAEIEAMGTDLAAFLTVFGIPADVPKEATLGSLAEEYGFTVREARDYIESR